MNSEIKQRIERINLGEVPDGYLKTKIGILPRDWEIVNMNKIIYDVFNGVFNAPSKVGKGIKLINVVNLYTEPYLRTEKLSLLDISKNEIEKYKVKKYDILFTRSSLKLDGVAHCNMNLNNKEDIVFDCHIIKATPKENLCYPPYLRLSCIAYSWRKQAMAVAKITTMATIGQDDIKKIKLPLPTLPEQKKIADILYTWDKAIEFKQQYLETLETRKKGVMRNLLTGNIRLAGFTNAWETVRFESVLGFVKKAPLENPKSYFLLTVKLYTKGIEPTNNKPKDTINGRPYYLRYPNELLIGRQNFHNGGIGIIPQNMEGYIASNAISSVYSKKGDLLFYYYYLSNEMFYKRIGEIIGGTGQKEISENMIKKLKLHIPSDENEKTAIAKVLSLADLEISMQKAELETLKLQKKGLMQVLLTGKVRTI
jgi:type I restriction enzyme S subunit